MNAANRQIQQQNGKTAPPEREDTASEKNQRVLMAALAEQQRQARGL